MVYHFEEISKFNEREIPEQSIFPGSNPKLHHVTSFPSFKKLN
jgi:hypothetical protein